MSGPDRRAKTSAPPEVPTGYRSSRRGSKSLKQAKKAQMQHRLLSGVQRTGKGVKNVVIVTLQGIAAVVATVALLLVAAYLINAGVRWNAERIATKDIEVAKLERRVRQNLLVIGADGERAVGFLALRIDDKNRQVFGIAIPDGAFLDVPGQGFLRVGEAYPSGPDVVSSTISNYLTVQFRSYIVVPGSVYRAALTKQSVDRLVEGSEKSNLSANDLDALQEQLVKIPPKNVALVPMPVQPISLGDQTYLEPHKEKVADLLKTWWGIDSAEGRQATRVVVYNGAGVPGIAGEAAQRLIRGGLRVVDTQNADSFDYDSTKIVVRRGDAARGNEVRKVLGIGSVDVQPSGQNVTDVIVIIGKDYEQISRKKE